MAGGPTYDHRKRQTESNFPGRDGPRARAGKMGGHARAEEEGAKMGR